MPILSINITNYVPFYGLSLLLRDGRQRVREILKVREGVRGKRQREKGIRETSQVLVCLLPSVTPRSGLGVCPVKVKKEGNGVMEGPIGDGSYILHCFVIINI